jgi:hypothetical protein
MLYFLLTAGEHFEYMIYVTRFVFNVSVGDGCIIPTHFHMVCSAYGISHGYGILTIVGMSILTRYVAFGH